jgi:hypothetical protein
MGTMRLPAVPTRLLASAVLAAGVVVVTSSQLAPTDTATATTATPTTPPAVLPQIGPIQTVDQNDVGDPYVLTVPPGITPPAAGIPYMNTGPDAYVSAPWTPADAADARAHGWYVLFGTTDWQSNVPTAISTDLVHWTQVPDALPVLPSWAESNTTLTWAPAAIHSGNRWILYFSTEYEAGETECIGRAVATGPAGPYTDQSSAPLVCQRADGGSIDPSVVSSGGAEYLVWKNDGNSAHKPDYIWSQRLSADLLSVAGRPNRLLGASEAWELGIVEAPAMVPDRRGGDWLFYSGGSWDSDRYGTGLAHCASVVGPCEATSSGPFLATTGDVISPGGLDTFIDRTGHRWAAFTGLVEVPSTWHPGRHYYNRVLDVAPFSG